MRTPIHFLTFIFSLSVFTLILISCSKESSILPIGTATATADPEIDFIAEQDFDSTMTFEAALKSIDPDVRPNWGVAIKAYTCIRNGQTLLVYNPSEPNLRYYDSHRFSIHWFKDGRPVRGIGIQLECVCKGRYAVIVINKRTQQGVGIAKYWARACFDNALETTIQYPGPGDLILSF